MKLFQPVRPASRDMGEALAAMAGFVRVLERLRSETAPKAAPERPAWPMRILQEKP